MATEPIITPPFRLAFPEVFTPKAIGQDGVAGTGKPKYSVTMLFPKDESKHFIPGTPSTTIEIRKILFAAAKEKWGDDRWAWPVNLGGLPAKEHAALKAKYGDDRSKWPPIAFNPKTFTSPLGKDGWALRDGDMVEWDGFAGHVFARAASVYAPGVVNAKLQAIINAGDVRGGLICRAQINAYAYDASGNRGVTLGLNNLQVLKDDGVVFGGSAGAASVFDPFETSAGAAANGGFDDFGGVPEEPFA